MTRVRRIDIQGNETLAPPQRLPNGSWVLEGFATRAGVLRYVNPDGSVRLEFRSPETLAKAAENLRNCMLTQRHPKEGYVSPANAATYSRGLVLDSTWEAESNRVRTRCIVMDQRLLDDLATGTRELSPGYEATVREEAGVWEGQPYTHVQEDISHNHLAVVPRGRAGPECSLRLDEDGNVEAESEEQPIPPLPVPAIDTHSATPSNEGRTDTTPSSEGSQEKPMEFEVTIDGKTFKVPEALKQAIDAERTVMVQKLKDAEGKATTSASEVGELKVELDEKKGLVGELEKKLDAANAEKGRLAVKLTSTTDDLRRLEQQRNDSADPANIAKLVQSRLSLATKVQPILGAKYDYASTSEHKMRCDALEKMLDGKPAMKKLLDEAIAAKDEARVSTIFDIEAARLDAAGGSLGDTHADPPKVPPSNPMEVARKHHESIAQRQREHKL